MLTFPARRATRTGALVVVTDPATAHALIGQLVELAAPDGSAAFGRVSRVGRPWSDGTASRVYAYIDPTSITPAA